ncbi:hypothetical protein [Paenibacillus pseudetheri]|uniref:NB-ARC domain-containing protein n=1 Tax=Paenibacillus pseudetheri TaxID=2897682 RepID=A0ABN8FPC5_9BACL|nr:hypothetical protein [Paenibacillus pseudetheri]CAH1059856.1 hypothetical protein PAECIP111894_06070 [Paenibacillus pseudetheri]
MYSINSDGYKIIFYIENILRDYIAKNFNESLLPRDLRIDAEKNAVINSAVLPLDYRNLLDYLHLGQLYDLIKSKTFISVKSNYSRNINISDLIKRRNNIMHSRVISSEELEIIKETGTKYIDSLSDNEFKMQWDKFLAEEISNYSIPLLFVEYPLGKNFETLVGRGDELKNLKNAIKIPTPVSIIRHGGVGKTALALQLAEDLLYSPKRPFDRIYFMSFKNTAYVNGQIKKLEKVISNHNELIYRLASFMEIDSPMDYLFDDLEKIVWENIFSTKSLLILDNLETEVVRSNLAEFTQIADRFMQNYAHPSRLVITSRYGLGDREQKFPLYEFDVERTKQLIKINLQDKDEKLKSVTPVDWDWVQEYSQGNPGLILAFCNTFKNTQKKMLDLRVEYTSKYSGEARELHDSQDTFLEFCFDNTIDSLSKESQIFLSALCYLCEEASINEISEELITFLIDEMEFGKLGFHNLKAVNYVNVGFLQPIISSDRYYVNELFIEYLNGNFAESNLFTVFDLKKSKWFPLLKKIVSSILDIQFDEELSLGQMLSKLYKAKYQETNDNSFLLKSFLCDPSLFNLLHYYEQAESKDVINNLNLLDKLRAVLSQNKDKSIQEKICLRIIDCLVHINQLIKSKKIRDFRQCDLLEYFEQLEKKIWILRNNNLSVKVRRKICDFLININDLDKAEQYLQTHEKSIQKTAFDLYTKKIGISANSDKNNCEIYITKCQSILGSYYASELSVIAKVRFFICSARYYVKINPKLALKNACLLDEYEIVNSTLYSFYLESLLIRAECILQINRRPDEVIELIKSYKKAIENQMYQQLFPKKRNSFEATLIRIERQCKGKSS